MAVGAVTTLTGFFGQFVSPFQPVSFTEKLDQLPAGNPAERQDKMSQMEIFLADRAAMEIKARRWKAHLLPTAVNLASGMITWLAFDRTVWDGVANFALNCVVTEAQIWSQPIRARKELKHYNTQFGSQNIVMHLSREIKWNLIVSLKGAGVRMVF